MEWPTISLPVVKVFVRCSLIVSENDPSPATEVTNKV